MARAYPGPFFQVAAGKQNRARSSLLSLGQALTTLLGPGLSGFGWPPLPWLTEGSGLCESRQFLTIFLQPLAQISHARDTPIVLPASSD